MCLNVVVCCCSVSHCPFAVYVTCVGMEIALRALNWRSSFASSRMRSCWLLVGTGEQSFSWGCHSTFPISFPIFFCGVFWSLQERSQEGELVGKALLACHQPWDRTQHALQLPLWCCGYLQLWMLFAFCFQALALALPCSTSPAFRLTPRGRQGGTTAPCIGFLHRRLGCSTNACCRTCGHISQDCTPSAVLERIEAGEERNSSCFQVFASVVFISLPFFFFLHPKGSFALQGKSLLSSSLTAVAITLSPPEQKLRRCRWKKLVG